MKLTKFYRNKKVLVTGATGFKGAWLSYWLHILGAKVFAIGYSPNKNKNLFYSLNLHKNNQSLSSEEVELQLLEQSESDSLLSY